MEEQESNDQNKYRCKIVVKQEELHFKSQKVTTVEIDEIKENIRLKIWNDTEDHTEGMNGNKMDKNDKEHQKRDQESNNTGLGTIENNKHPGAEGEQHTGRNKLKGRLSNDVV